MLVLVAGRALRFGWKLWQPMWEVPILLRLRFAQRPLRLGAPEMLESVVGELGQVGLKDRESVGP